MDLATIAAIAGIVGTAIAIWSLVSTKRNDKGHILVDVDPASRLGEALRERSAEEKKPDIVKKTTVTLSHNAFSSSDLGTDAFYSDLIASLKKKEGKDEISIKIEDHE